MLFFALLMKDGTGRTSALYSCFFLLPSSILPFPHIAGTLHLSSLRCPHIASFPGFIGVDVSSPSPQTYQPASLAATDCNGFDFR